MKETFFKRSESYNRPILQSSQHTCRGYTTWSLVNEHASLGQSGRVHCCGCGPLTSDSKGADHSSRSTKRPSYPRGLPLSLSRGPPSKRSPVPPLLRSDQATRYSLPHCTNIIKTEQTSNPHTKHSKYLSTFLVSKSRILLKGVNISDHDFVRFHLKTYGVILYR